MKFKKQTFPNSYLHSNLKKNKDEQPTIHTLQHNIKNKVTSKLTSFISQNT